MSSSLNKALEKIRDESSNTVEKGAAFEKLSKIYFENDDIQKQEFNKIWHYKDWAKKNSSFSKTDIGIDLIGELKDGKGLAAIQCKFFQSHYQITKEDLDSFISASSNKIFTRLILVDTSNEDLGSNAKSMIDNLNKGYQRIQKYNLENSRIDWLDYIDNKKVSLSKKKKPRDHQLKAIQEAKKHYSQNDRGKMIMACGTGKTFTSLKIAEEIASKKLILYMVPSLALMSQSIREWKNDCSEDFVAFSACSDKKVGKIKNDNDHIQIKLNELAIPATTDSKKLAEEINGIEKDKMIVVFSTYQSIDVISDAQKKFSLKSFDLIICDEAHRTTGATFEEEEDSYFVRIHDDKFVKGIKRLYMTATPRIFGSKAKKKADAGSVELASMDDPEKFGKEFFNRGFNWAVENSLLSDYKVVILAVDEGLVNSGLQKSLEDGSELKLSDATKIIGVYKALAKVGFDKKENEKLKPIKKALAFTQSIEISKIFDKEFTNVINEYTQNENIKEVNKQNLNVEIQHIDGTFNADQRNNSLNWLKSNTDKKTCRILSNVKCLSEGVDVPSLDAIMFLHPKKSQIDVVQAVGRVMRRAEGKDMGYVIIPVTVAPGVAPEKALNDNEKYKVVWQIVNALRTHDERLDSKINMLSLGEDISDKLEIISMSAEQDATTAEVEDVKKKNINKKKDDEEVINLNQGNQEKTEEGVDRKEQMTFELDDLSQAIKAKIVQKCGTRDYWENWATDIAEIAKKHISILNEILVKKKSPKRNIFEKFLSELKDDLNPEIDENDAIEMLAQHIITKPVFETLFSGSKFTKENPISKALEETASLLVEKEKLIISSTLTNFYESVKRRARDIVTSNGKTQLINELYERFFKNAFPLTTQRLGIVYTPLEVVDFINNSVDYLMRKEFSKSFSNNNVHILDPFTGTGTFITRLIQSNLIEKNKLAHKFKNEIHANEIVLLAYYIAGINIESSYFDKTKENQYHNFNGLVITDTFQLYEQERDMIADLLPDNSQKRTKQKNLKITAIIGNPPYSVGQKSENQDAKNVKYNNLDEKIRSTYLKNSNATLSRNLFDSYIRSIRWASDRVDKNGIIAFITGSGFLNASFADGMRKSLSNEFSKILIIDLKGNVRNSILNKGDKSEGENIFGQGSMTGVSINIFIKNEKLLKEKAEIFYYNLGDNLEKKQKLAKINNLLSVEKIIQKNEFQKIEIDKYGDWFNHRDPNFEKNVKMGSRKKGKNTIFLNYSQGILTSRDSWCINFSKKKLTKNIKFLINNYNKQFEIIKDKIKIEKQKDQIFQKLEKNPKKISWSRSLKKQFFNLEKLKFDEKKIVLCNHKPFIKSYLYLCKNLNEEVYKMPNIFNDTIKNNKVIMVKNRWSSGQIAFMSKHIPIYSPDGGEHCFPLYYKNADEKLGGLFSESKNDNEISLNCISAETLSYFKKKYINKKINEQDIFYYIYALLHSKEYLEKYKKNLVKDLPYIPLQKLFSDFCKFADIGHKLSDLHTNYENAKKYPINIIIKDNDISDNHKLYRLDRMQIYKSGKVKDKTKIHYNKYINLEGIPLQAYDYIIYGKSALDWIIDRYSFRVDNNAEIENDPNDFASESIKNPSYPLELLQRVITVSIETQKLIQSLPKFKALQ